MRILFTLLSLCLFIKPQALGQRQKILIEVADKETGTLIPDALIQSELYSEYSEAEGLVWWPAGDSSDSISISALGYHSITIAQPNARIKVNLKPLRLSLREVLVLDKQDKAEQHLRNEVLKSSVTYKEMRSYTSMLGIGDIIRPLANLPGVQSSVPGSSTLYVRGGDSYHNSMYLDDVPFYNMDHAFGFVSAIPGLSVESIDLYKEGIPARFGNSLSSAMDIRSVKPSTKKWTGKISWGLADLGFHINAPVVEDKLAVSAGIRRSLTDLIFPLADASSGARVNFWLGFGDYNFKTSYRINKHSKLEALLFHGQNRVVNRVGSKFQQEAKTYSQIASLKYQLQAGNTFYQQQIFYSGYDFSFLHTHDNTTILLQNLPSDYAIYTYNTALNHWGSRSSMKFSENARTWELGVDLNYLHNQNPEFQYADSATLASSRSELFNIALYGDLDFQINTRWRANLGLRLEAFSKISPSLQILPKAVLSYTTNEHWSFFGAYDRSSSYIHRFRSGYEASPTDLPFLANGNRPASNMDQISTGLVYKNKILSINSALFYRNYSGVLDRDYQENGNLYPISYLGLNPLSDLSKGTERVNGWAYGWENRAQLQFGIARLDLAYTWSRAFRQSDELNNGKAYHFEFNREHSFNSTFLLRFKKNKINKITELSISYTYGSGNYTQFALQQQLNPFDHLPYGFISNRNNAQLPSIQHLDFSFHFIKEKEKGTRVFTISVFNATLNENIFRYSEISTLSGSPELRGEVTLPIYPSISYAYYF